MTTPPSPNDGLDPLPRSIVLGGVWSLPSVDEDPSCELARSRVVECQGERHFVGWCIRDREGRVSSGIRGLDHTTRRGITACGRVDALIGPPGHHPDAEYVLQHWLHRNGIRLDVVHDVTPQLIATEPD